MEPHELRGALSAALHGSESEALRKLGKVVAGDACWGNIAEALDALCSNDSDYLTLLDILISLGDTRALLLLVHAARTRARALVHMLERAADLPRSVQCMLVTLPECAGHLDRLSTGACAAAHELVREPQKRVTSRQVYAAHVGSLHAMRWGTSVEAQP